jgi:telomerase protein component 1
MPESTHPGSSFSNWKTVRVFISSTFRDMHAERDYLVKYVFPELREWCQQYKLHLVDIDLRWGVTSSEAESGKVLDICLDQIDGSRPFFIGILGNRYGWVPNKNEVSEGTRKIYDRLNGKEDFSITHLEIHHAVLEPLRSLDTMEEVPHAFFYFRDKDSHPSPNELQNYSEQEKEEYLTTYFEKDINRDNQLKKLKQEIQKHYQNIGEIKNNFSELEERVYIYHPHFDPYLSNPEDDKLRGRFTPESFKEFGIRVQSDLKKAISLQFYERIKTLSERKDQNSLETEKDLHESFVENRTRLFIGRAELLKRLHEYVNGNSRKILAVYGEPGSGKSALLAEFYRNFKYDENGNEINKNVLFIPHFAGASPGSCFLPTVLRRFCEELKVAFDIKESIPGESNKLTETFKDFVNKARGTVIILIDGLNQLDESEHAHELNWLPVELPINLKIIASTLESRSKDALTKKTYESIIVTQLTDEECREIINKIPSVFCKTLDEKHIKLLLTKEETRNPLYLKVALDELRVFGSFEKLETRIAALPSDIESLFISVLERLEKDCTEESGIVERLFCLLECSRFGLAPQELRKLMESDDKHNTYQAILRQMRDYLIPRGELIDFFHRGLSKAIRQKYLQNGEEVKWHQILAKFMEDQQLRIGVQKQKEKQTLQPNIRKLREQSWQETKGELWKELEDTLTSLDYIETKCEAELKFELVEDYNIAQQAWPGNEEQKNKEDRLLQIKKYTEELIAFNKDPHHSSLPESPQVSFSSEVINQQQIWSPLERIQTWGHFVANNITIIQSKEPVYQLAYNYADSGPIVQKIDKIDKTGSKQVTPWIKLLNRPSYSSIPACIRVLYAFHADVLSVAISADGLRAITASRFDLQVWNLETGECEMVLTGKVCVAITADGLRAISIDPSYEGNRMKIWDMESGLCLKELQVDTKGIDIISMTYDGRFAVCSNYYRFSLWDLGTYECLYVSEDFSRIHDICISPDASYVAFVLNQSRVALVRNLKQQKTYECHGSANGGFIDCITITYDGKKLVAASGSEIRMWNLENGEIISMCENRIDTPTDIAVTPDGKYAVTGSDRKLYVWDLQNGRYLKSFEEPGVMFISSVSITPDCRFALTGERFGTIRLWDLQATSKYIQERHHYCIGDVSTQMDKSIILSCATVGLRSVDADPDVRFWDINTQKCTQIIKHNESDWRGLFVNTNGKQFITGHSKSLNLWDLNGVLIQKLETDTRNISGFWRYKLFITQDGKKAIFHQWDKKQHGTLLVWDLLSGQKSEINGDTHTDSIQDIKITSDGRQAITTSTDKTLRIWDLEDMKCIGEMRGHQSRVESVSIAPDNRSCISQAEKDKSLIMWDLKSKQVIKQFPAYSRTDQVFILLDGRSIFSRGVSMGYYAGINNIRQEKSFIVRGFNEVATGTISYDNNYILSWNGGSIKIFDLQKGINIVQLTLKGDSFTSCGFSWPKLVFGRASGIVNFISVENLPLGPAIVSPVRIWLFAPFGHRGHWDEHITTLCPWCDHRFPSQQKILNVIDGITHDANLTPEQSPCLYLPDEAWEESKLISECPSCKKQLKYNPFKVDNKD